MVFLHDASPSQDVLHVGKRKAMGYVLFSEAPQPRYIEPVELEALAADLASRGMETRCYRSVADGGHMKEIEALCQALPLFPYAQKLHPAFSIMPSSALEFYAFDRDTIESLLESNRAFLLDFPATADAFVDLARSAWLLEETPLNCLLTTAFGCRFTTLYDKGRAPFPYYRQFELGRRQTTPNL